MNAELSPIYNSLQKASDEIGEDNDCSVKAVAVVCQVSYRDSHEALRISGRSRQQGASEQVVVEAIWALGHKVVKRVPLVNDIKRFGVFCINTRTVPKFHEVWEPSKKYLAFCNGHVIGIANSLVHDFTANQDEPILWAYEIE